MNTLKNLDIDGKFILLRTDFDVAVEEGVIVEPFRILKQKSLLDHLIKGGAKILMVSHVSAIDSFKPIIHQIEDLLGYKIEILTELDNLNSAILSSSKNLFLLDNIRNWEGEKNNDRQFAYQLSNDFDLYINNAFAVSHRRHASVSAVCELLPSYAGPLLEAEIVQLKKIIDSPSEGKIIIMGGAKGETKVPVIKNFINKAEKIIVGGVIANDFIKARGGDVGNSLIDLNAAELLSGIDLYDPGVIIPEDFNVSEGKFLDIGPKSIERFVKAIKGSGFIIWNGPMGLFEDSRFLAGTEGIARAICSAEAYKVIGGGDTISAVNKLGLLDKFDFVSTGGGAMLEFLAGNKLPGLEALGYYK